MICLGINEDLFDSGAALCDGSRVLFAANEERYSRRKNEGGFPHKSLDALMKATGVEPSDVDCICVSGIMTPPLPVRIFPRMHNWIFDALRSRNETLFKRLMDMAMFMTPVSHTSDTSLLRSITRPFLAPATRRTLPKPLRGIGLNFVDHHRAHAAGAWHCSGYEEALAITADGMGDGVSLTVSRCTAGTGVERLWSAPSRSSLGMFFEVLAESFGFVSCRDEGKITGLAACGDASRVQEPSPFAFVDGRLEYRGLHGRQGIEWAKRTLTARYSREDVAAWAQAILEDTLAEVAARWLRETGLKRLVVAGGVFANVRLNQRLHELDEVESLFVYPNMGDGGLSLGVIRDTQALPPEKISNVFLGDSFSKAEIESALARASLDFEHCPAMEERVAELLAEGRIVARFDGAMEWGPRALGNRSILVRTSDRDVVARLNTLLRRSDFMPFAPAVIAEDSGEYVLGADKARHAAEFMTVCFACTQRMKDEHPAVVHVDGTARAQLVVKENNPGFHEILRCFKQRSGTGVVLNTSFNIHEEPIVRTPDEAITAFLKARLDYLAIGEFLVKCPF
jgi:carbamoyltransferase